MVTLKNTNLDDKYLSERGYNKNKILINHSSCSSLVIREKQLETIMRYHYTPTRLAKIPTPGKESE